MGHARFSPHQSCTVRSGTPACFAKAVCDKPEASTISFMVMCANIPDLGKAPFFSVQIHAPVGIIRDAEGDTVEGKPSREAAGSVAALKSSAVVYMVDFLSFVW